MRPLNVNPRLKFFHTNISLNCHRMTLLVGNILGACHRQQGFIGFAFLGIPVGMVVEVFE
jgi:hypothetical protein